MRSASLARSFVLLALLSTAAPSAATTYFVDRFDDAPNADNCTFLSGDCSLRGAVRLANSTIAADEIRLANGSYLLTVAGAPEDQAATGDLDVLEDLTISVLPGARPTIVQTTADRVFHLQGASANVAFVGPMTLQGGFADGDIALGHGGSIYIASGDAVELTDVTLSGASAEDFGGCLASFLEDSGDSLTLTDVRMLGCSAWTGGGAAIVVGDGAVLLDRVRIESCHATIEGGGLWIGAGPALVIVRDSILRHNTVGDASYEGRGGGLHVSSNTNVRLAGSSVVGNVAGVPASVQGGAGGGLRVEIGAQLEVRNSTVSGNRTRGGLRPSPGAEVLGTLELDHATVVDNRSEPEGSRAIRLVGGTLFSEASLVEGGCDEAGNSFVVSQGYNVERPTDGGVTTECGFTDPSDVLTTDLVVRPLAGNGGPTPTHALAPGSPAQGLVPAAVCAAQDQRHAPRSLSFCDAGSFESSGQAPGPWIFDDGYESGDSFAWSATTP